MGKFGRGMGRAGLASTVSALSGIGASIREHRAEEEAGKISKIRVPIGPRVTQPKAIKTPIGEAIAGREEQLMSPTGEPITAPMDIPSEQAAAEQQYGETQKALQNEKDLEVQNIDEIGIMKELEPFPTAKSHLYNLAEANGWIEMVGGVPTISNRQLQLAKGIIAGDLKLQKELNELALGDITQNITGLKQSMLDPKMKDEERAQTQVQIDTLTGQQNSVLNAVNKMDREIQKGLALRTPAAPAAAAEVDTTNLMYQDKKGNYRWGLHDESGNLVKDLRAATSKETKDKDAKGLDVGKYRSYLKDATSNAYKELFANDETMMQEIAQLDADISEEEKAKIEAKIHRDLSPTQRARLSELKEKWFKDEAPESIWKQYRKIKGAKRKGTKAIADPLGLR